MSSKIIDFTNVRGPLSVVEDELELGNVQYLAICMVTGDGDTIITESDKDNISLYDASIFAHHFETRRQQCLRDIDEEAESF